VNADIFLLTDKRPVTGQEFGILGIGASSVGDELPGAPGLVVKQQVTMNRQLHNDLVSDRNMSWVPRDAWVTHMTLEAASPTVTYDMSVAGDGSIRLASLGTTPPSAINDPPSPAFTPHPRMNGASLAAVLGIALVPLALILYAVHVHTRPKRKPTA
jgi:hypothetical protein